LKKEDKKAKLIDQQEIQKLKHKIVNKLENFLMKQINLEEDKVKNKFKKKRGETVKEYEERVREIRINEHFKKFMRRHQQLVKEETAFHNTAYDEELLRRPEWMNQTAINKAKSNYIFSNKGEILKSQKVKSVSPVKIDLNCNFEKKQKKSAFQQNVEQTR
jgi:hypothetical protein